MGLVRSLSYNPWWFSRANITMFGDMDNYKVTERRCMIMACGSKKTKGGK